MVYETGKLSRKVSQRNAHCCPHCSRHAGHEARRSASDDNALAIRMVALLKEETVAEQMKALFYPKELVAEISSLTANVDYLTTQLNIRAVLQGPDVEDFPTD